MKVEHDDNGNFFLLNNEGEKLKLGDFQETRQLLSMLREDVDYYIHDTMIALKEEVSQLTADDDDEDEDDLEEDLKDSLDDDLDNDDDGDDDDDWDDDDFDDDDDE